MSLWAYESLSEVACVNIDFYEINLGKPREWIFKLPLLTYFICQKSVNKQKRPKTNTHTHTQKKRVKERGQKRQHQKSTLIYQLHLQNLCHVPTQILDSLDKDWQFRWVTLMCGGGGVIHLCGIQQTPGLSALCPHPTTGITKTCHTNWLLHSF